MSLATLKLAVKVLLRRKFFTAVSLFAISVTLVVLMVAAALLDHVVGAMPPESRQGRMLSVRWGQMSPRAQPWNGTLGYPLPRPPGPHAPKKGRGRDGPLGARHGGGLGAGERRSRHGSRGTDGLFFRHLSTSRSSRGSPTGWTTRRTRGPWS